MCSDVEAFAVVIVHGVGELKRKKLSRTKNEVKTFKNKDFIEGVI
jgi:hypothetical protein